MNRQTSPRRTSLYRFAPGPPSPGADEQGTDANSPEARNIDAIEHPVHRYVAHQHTQVAGLAQVRASRTRFTRSSARWAPAPAPALTRVDPALPLCWESPDTLRLGFDRAEVRIPSPSAATQRLLDALRAGVPFGTLNRVAQHVGATAAERRALVERLAPVLVSCVAAEPAEADTDTDTEADAEATGITAATTDTAAATATSIATTTTTRLRIAVHGRGDAATILREASVRAGHEVVRWNPGLESQCADEPEPNPIPPSDLVIVVERFLLPTRTTQLLIEHEIPHLLVRFSDRSVRVGPLVLPGSGPCTVCVTLHDTDGDPSLPTLAAQLPGSTPASETRACAETAATMVMGVIHHWIAGAEWPQVLRLRAEVREGLPMPVIDSETMTRHPACGCELRRLGGRMHGASRRS